jgi:hypothetical protein
VKGPADRLGQGLVQDTVGMGVDGPLAVNPKVSVQLLIADEPLSAIVTLAVNPPVQLLETYVT